MFKTLRVLTSLILFIFVLYPDGCAMLQIQKFSRPPRSGYFGNAENNVIKYNQLPEFEISTRASRKSILKYKKDRASNYEASLNEKAITDKLVLSPIIVRAKLLKIIKSKKNASHKKLKMTDKEHVRGGVFKIMKVIKGNFAKGKSWSVNHFNHNQKERDLMKTNCSQLSDIIHVKFAKAYFNKQHAVISHKLKQKLRKRKLRNISWRLNRLYVVYLNPDIINKKKRQNQMKRNRSGKNLCNIRKLKAYSLPDPWTGRLKKKVKKVLCQKCNKKPRTFYSKDTKFNDGDSIPLELGERIRLRCNFKGNPKPNIAWYKNEKMIDSDEMDSNESLPRMKITTKRSKSILRIRRSDVTDAGAYKCVASSTLGYDILPFHISFKPKIGEKRTCPHRRFCLNGGNCEYYHSIREQICKCKDGFHGVRCEYKTRPFLNWPYE